LQKARYKADLRNATYGVQQFRAINMLCLSNNSRLEIVLMRDAQYTAPNCGKYTKQMPGLLIGQR